MKIFKFVGCTILLAGLCAGTFTTATASEAPRRIVTEDIPNLRPIKYVSANQTHSGYPVPRYVSLKFDRVNGRQGPSLQHPALWQYQRRGMPLIVVAEMDIWRKVRDMNGDESWVRTQALSGERNAITVTETPLYRKPKLGASIEAMASKDTLLGIVECRSDDWCRVKAESGHKGWIERKNLWGAAPL